MKGKEVSVPDVRKEPRLRPVLGLLSHEGHRSIAGFPLQSRRKVLGALFVYHDQTRSYSPSERELARTFASHAAIAMERAQHHESTLKELRERKALSESSRKITSS